MVMESNWRTKALVVGGAVGALLGLGAAYIFINSAEDSDAPPELTPGTAVTIGLALLALLRQVAAIGEGDDEGEKRKIRKVR
jgi:hypothetical protein